MPNTLPPVRDAAGIESYRNEIRAAAPGLEPLMTFKLLPGMEPEEVARMKKAGALAGKYYPAGATTNAEDGFARLKAAFPLFHTLQAEGLVLCIHAEDPEAPVFRREEAFLPQVAEIIENFPRLKIVVEHLSTRAAVEALRGWPDRVGATISAHHLAFSVEDLLGGRLDHSLFCKPVVKSEDDRRALVEAAVSGEAKFFFGSDSAPHSREAKASGAAGAFSAPVALPLLAGVFDEAGRCEMLEDFCSRRGAEFYGLPLNEGEISLVPETWTVPDEYGNLVPLCAGQSLSWALRAL
jgi:dihydroorotase